MSETVIEVDNISKLYRLGEVGTGSLAHDVNRWWHRVRGKEDPYSQVGQVNDRTKKAESDWVWALKDINFEVKQGDVLGIIGRNGAGKSTLLKILSRVTAPSTGEVRVKGRIASLLEVGTGFHPELTGRENIFLNGAILGMTRAEIRAKLDEIVSFSGCEAYLDTPVKRYSSGMQVRLAFAVAAHLEPEILIVDEVLAVGDAEFQKRCVGRMSEVAKEGRTVLFVSHNMNAVHALCGTGMVLKEGQPEFAGDISRAIEIYCEQGKWGAQSTWQRVAPVNESVCFLKASLNLTGKQPDMFLELEAHMICQRPSARVMVAIDIFDTLGDQILQVLPEPFPFIECSKGEFVVSLRIQLPPLIPGSYGVGLWTGAYYSETLEQIKTALAFDITESPTPGRSFPHSRKEGFSFPKCTYRIEGSADIK
ncbi:ABC transporter ATP-binding protein [Roseimicrobium sp. ORNL1]|uniref:ABC transporter ATP-binding protein n=1 Tax=Roseimicrobium sp. ORNL1 TaxID=2711231 RepID=UPI0013E112CD|nr:ABC transporter ATP-binding protein [Roseimicrobium sp. ORNL1]QIF02951.1 ABC transporter ATP-binding protein [Roseimicrobium sp. ORNL1]